MDSPLFGSVDIRRCGECLAALSEDEGRCGDCDDETDWCEDCKNRIHYPEVHPEL